MFRILILSFISSVILISVSEAKPPIVEGETDPVMLDLDPYMIDALRGTYDKRAGKGKYGFEGSIIDLAKEKEFQALIKKHDLELFNGPMLGSITDQSAKVWIRTVTPGEFQVVINDSLKSESVKTTSENDNTGVALIKGLKPFTEYQYKIILNGKTISKPYFKIHTAPASGQKAKYSITFGSGARYIPIKEGIWRTMAKHGPLAYLGLGDNVYIDAGKYFNAQRLHYYRRMLRQEYREMIASTGIYAMWDDHDLYENDSEGGYGLDKKKLTCLKVFSENWNNPFNGLPPEAPGTYFNFRMGDVEVIMIDGRFYRYGERSAKKSKEKRPTTMMGKIQMEWVLKTLRKSTATFKVLASGTMWHDLADKGGADSWASPNFKQERDAIFDLISKEKINGVILIAGDRHRTDIWKTERPGYPLYEFLSGKMTNVHGHNPRKEALWSYGGKIGQQGNGENYWGHLEFDTTLDDPMVTFKAITSENKVLKEFPVKLSEISHKND